MLSRRSLLLTTAAVLLLPGCGETSGPEAVRWERDACEECRMIISERHFATQLRGGPNKRVYKFDDIGCAVHWARKRNWGEADIAEFWAMNHDNGATWLDARRAHFRIDVRSPMNYNFGAVPDPRDSSVPYADMIARLAVGQSHSSCETDGEVLAAAGER